LHRFLSVWSFLDYYQSGAHADYILYMTDAAQSSSDVDRMRQEMRDTKGLSNFHNLFI